MTGSSPSEAPLLTFVVDGQGADRSSLARTLESLVAQDDSGWQLVLVGEPLMPGSDGSDGSDLLGSEDDRVVVLPVTGGDPGERAERARTGAGGVYLALLEPGARLDPSTVSSVRGEVTGSEVAPDVVYTDERVPGRTRAVVLPKPVWSPIRLRAHLWPGRLCALRGALVDRVGGFASGLDGAHEIDLLLRLTEAGASAVRLPLPLHDSTASARPADDAARDRGHLRAVQSHLDRVGLPAVAVPGLRPGTVGLRRSPGSRPSISVVMTTAGRSGLAWGERRSFVLQAVLSLLENTTEATLQVVVVHSDKTPPPVLAALKAHAGAAVVLAPAGPAATFGAMVNVGLLRCHGEIVVAMEDCVEPDSPDFLAELTALLADPGVGLTGPRLLRSDSRHLGAGVAVFARTDQPMFQGWPDESDSPGDLLAVTRECSALLPTCIAARTDTLLDVGGFSSHFSVLAHLDLAAKLEHRGLSRVWVPGARLRVFPEPKDLPPASAAERHAYLRRWPSPALDPFVPTYGVGHLRRSLKQQQSDGAASAG